MGCLTIKIFCCLVFVIATSHSQLWCLLTSQITMPGLYIVHTSVCDAHRLEFYNKIMQKKKKENFQRFCRMNYCRFNREKRDDDMDIYMYESRRVVWIIVFFFPSSFFYTQCAWIGSFVNRSIEKPKNEKCCVSSAALGSTCDRGTRVFIRTFCVRKFL